MPCCKPDRNESNQTKPKSNSVLYIVQQSVQHIRIVQLLSILLVRHENVVVSVRFSNVLVLAGNATPTGFQQTETKHKI